MKQTHLRSIILVTSIFTICACEPSQEIFPDWHQWMGPQRDGSWVTDLDKDTLKAGDMKKIWETAIGSGYCGPTTYDGKVYVMDLLNKLPNFLTVAGLPVISKSFIQRSEPIPSSNATVVGNHSGLQVSLESSG